MNAVHLPFTFLKRRMNMNTSEFINKRFTLRRTKVVVGMDGADVWSHQSLGHGRFVLSREVLFQGQHHTVGGDGGQDHILKRCKGHKVKGFHFTSDETVEYTSIFSWFEFNY